ncbi:YdhK family protein [Brevibacterium luteolum]|uniref:YdhK family protein n=1 Tax=Brevibacterium luteolum TaxID=199591 RepID=UPI001C23D955|nr:YdhK family protein [Brevibacterium luteolum]MBU8578600.1 YdhK family protein [Brevibacterium luteolum]
MNRRMTTLVAAGIVGGSLALAGCATGAEDDTAPSATQTEDAHGGHGSHEDMEHPADGGPVPAGMTEATDPEYPVGTEVTLTADHMHGMDGATATIAGSTDETVYVVDYEADGMTMTNHKWVVESEMQPASWRSETGRGGTDRA